MSNHIDSPADNQVHECSQAQPESLEEWIAKFQKLQKEDSQHYIKPVTVHDLHDLPQVQFSEKGITRKPHDCIDFVKAERAALNFCKKYGPIPGIRTHSIQVMQVHEPQPPEGHNVQTAVSQTVEHTQ